MFQLFKQRNFSDIFNDTFGFLRANGKNFLRSYFTVCGPLLLLMVILMYFVGDVFFKSIFSSIGNPNNNQLIENYFDNNLGFFIGMGVLLSVILLINMLLNYSFPIIYFKFLEQNKQPTSKEMVMQIKAKAGKIFLFALLWLITFLPVIMIVSVVCVLLFSILIGIPLAIIAYAAMFSWIALSFINYLNTDDGYFTSFSKGFRILFNKFWVNSGTTAIFSIIIYFIQTIVSIIPYIVAVVYMVSNVNDGIPGEDSFSVLGISFLITMILSFLLSLILGNLLFINQGMIYYSYAEEHENRSAMSEIDLIGSIDE